MLESRNSKGTEKGIGVVRRIGHTIRGKSRERGPATTERTNYASRTLLTVRNGCDVTTCKNTLVKCEWA